MVKTKTILLRKVFHHMNFETQIEFLKDLRLMYLQNNTYINTSTCTTFRYTICLNRNYVPIYWSMKKWKLRLLKEIFNYNRIRTVLLYCGSCVQISFNCKILVLYFTNDVLSSFCKCKILGLLNLIQNYASENKFRIKSGNLILQVYDKHRFNIECVSTNNKLEDSIACIN